MRHLSVAFLPVLPGLENIYSNNGINRCGQNVNVAGVTPGPTVVTFVFTGTSIKYYINGALSRTVAESIGAITGSGPFYVGTYNASGYGGLPAGNLMDEFRMYNRALSDAEVGSTWNQQLPLSGPPVCVTATPLQLQVQRNPERNGQR